MDGYQVLINSKVRSHLRNTERGCVVKEGIIFPRPLWRGWRGHKFRCLRLANAQRLLKFAEVCESCRAVVGFGKYSSAAENMPQIMPKYQWYLLVPNSTLSFCANVTFFRNMKDYVKDFVTGSRYTDNYVHETIVVKSRYFMRKPLLGGIHWHCKEDT